MVLSLSNIQNQAKALKKQNNHITYNQALQSVSSNYGFRTYQALLIAAEIEYIKDDDLHISTIKQNIFKNRKHIQSNFIKLQNLQMKDDAIRNDEELDDEKREELFEELEEQATNLSSAIAGSVFGNSIEYKYTDNQMTCVEGCAFAAYVSANYLTIHNDIDAHNADFTLQLSIDTSTLELGYRYFIEEDGYKDWYDWNGIDIKLP